MRSLSPPEMITRVSSSASVAREKCSRNKRKFRQDPPFPNQVSTDGNHNGANNAATAISAEGDSWTSESRSVDATTAKSTCSNSSQKDHDSGTNSARKGESTARFYQENLKLMRWFRSGQGKVIQAGGTVAEGKVEQAAEDYKPCDTCEEEEEFYEVEEVDWDDCTEGELEDLLVKSLGALYNEAITKIVSSGHTADDALRAVLKQGRCYGGKDAVSNIVENAVAYLTGNKYASDGRDQTFSDLRELQKYGLAEMVGLLREVRPLLSKGDAMWCLLMCDMNVALACVMDDSAIPPCNKEPIVNHRGQLKVPSGSSPPLPPTESTSNSSNLPAMHPPAPSFLTPPDATFPPSVSSPITPSLTALSPPISTSPLPSSSMPDISLLSLSDSSPPSVSACITEISSTFEKSTTGSLSHVADPLLADVCLPKEATEHVTDVVISAQVPAIVSSSAEDKVDLVQELIIEPDADGISSQSHDPIICEAPSEAHGIAEPFGCVFEELPKDDGLDEVGSKQGFCGPNASTSVCDNQAHSSYVESNENAKNTEKALDSSSASVDTDLTPDPEESNSVQTESSCAVVKADEFVTSSMRFGTVEEPTSMITAERDSLNGGPSDGECSSSFADGAVVTGGMVQAADAMKVVPESLTKDTSGTGKADIEDQKDEMIMKLIHRARELETQLQERTEWAKQKVMQAARRLSKDLQELKSLRLEREEALRLKKDKQALEDSTMKKVTDLENALRKASSQVDRANASVRKLEAENAEVRAEMEAAKLSAAESQASCQEIAKRERKHTKRAQAWDKQKAKLQEDLSEEKRRNTVHQQQLALAKERQQQAEVRWRQEEKAKEEAILRADHERRSREQAEAAGKRREESFRRKAESNYQRHREDIQRLESEIAQLRTSAEATQLATSRWGPGVAVTPHLMELGSLHALKEQNIRLSREIAELQDLARRDVRRERECVMCMCEEMSVVFLPCAHQVVCVKCNDLHEKQGMRDCPSCRTPIKQRIRVYGVST